MAAFLALCLLLRLAYALNDVLVGRLVRQHSHVEVSALRGLSLGLTLAPLLAWVPAAAWQALAARWREYLLLIVVTAAANLLHNYAARFLPFGLRGALMLGALSVASVALGMLRFDERLSVAQAALCALIVGAAVLAALGTHAAHEIQPDVPRGAALALGSGVGFGIAAMMTKDLATQTDPLLTAWAWELGAGAILLVPLAWEWRHGVAPGLGARFVRVALAASPTVVGSTASMVALSRGALGLWGALAGTQVLFTALLGARWHHEAVGTGRWLCFAVAAAAVSGLALLSR